MLRQPWPIRHQQYFRTVGGNIADNNLVYRSIRELLISCLGHLYRR